METWKPVPFADEYEVSDLGNIRRVAPAIKRRDYGPIRGSLTYQGYMAVTLRHKGKRLQPRFLHRIIMEAFHGPSDLHVNHINGIKNDNRLCNLEYVTAADNRKHAMQVLDSFAKGAGHPNAKLVDADVVQIKSMIRAGISDRAISEIFGCTAANIYVIRKGKGWTHIQ